MQKRGLSGFACAVLSVAAASGAAAEPETGQIEAAGARFPFIAEGEGETVLFVHGAFADHRAWEGLREAVAEDHRFMSVALRHHGTEEWPEDQPYSRDVHAADLVAILQEIGEPVHLVGYSYSGPIVLRAALEVPDLVRSVTAFEPVAEPAIIAGRPGAEEALAAWGAGWAEPAAAMQAGDNEEALRKSIEYVFGMDKGGFQTLPAEVQTVMLENAHTVPSTLSRPEARPLTCEELAGLHPPALIVGGSETLPVWQVTTPAYAECIGDAELETIEGAGHGAPIQNRDAFRDILLDFLGRHSGDA